MEHLPQIGDVQCSLRALPAGSTPVTEWRPRPTYCAIELQGAAFFLDFQTVCPYYHALH